MKTLTRESKATLICAAFEVGRRAYQQGKSLYACAYKDAERTISFERGWKWEHDKQRGKARIAGAR